MAWLAWTRTDTCALYIKHLLHVFREVRCVLRPDGVCFIIIGDSYTGSGKGYGAVDHGKLGKQATAFLPKPLLTIPFRLALALQEEGWWVHSTIIWKKPNVLPSSIQDRLTTSHEYIFLLSKSQRYFYDLEAIREPAVRLGETQTFGGKKGRAFAPSPDDPTYRHSKEQWGKTVTSGRMRRRRSVWHIPTRPLSARSLGIDGIEHFAVMSTQLAEICVLAGSSPHACEHCDAPWKRIVAHTPVVVRRGPKAGGDGSRTNDRLLGTILTPAQAHRADWQPTCACANDTGAGACVVLDTFLA